MKRILLAVLIGLLPVHGRASMWMDPSFEEMIEMAEVIAVVEVQEEGTFDCPVKALETLKGALPSGVFQMCGYNDPQMEERGVQAETLHKGDRVLAFLSAIKNPPKLETNNEKRESLKKDVKWFAVPTPSCGDLTIRAGRIRGGCYFNSWPLSSPPIDASIVVELVRGAVSHREGKKPEAAQTLIRTKLTVEFIGKITAEESEANDQAAWLAHWLLWAAGDYGGAEPEAVLQAAASPHPFVQITAGRALRRLPPGPKSLAAAAALLRSKHSYAQAEGVRVLIGAPFDHNAAVAALLAALPDSSSAGRGSQNIMDPIQNRDASGRELMVRAIDHFGAAKEADATLVALVADKELSEGVFAALRDHFLKHRSDAARDRFIELFGRCPPESVPVFLTYLASEGSEPSRKAIAEKLLSPDLSDFERDDSLQELGRHQLPDDFLIETIRAIAEKFPDDPYTAEASVSVLCTLKTPAATALAAQRIIHGPLEGYDLDSAVETFALLAAPEPSALKALLKSVLERQSKADAKEQSNTTVSACILVADQDLLAFVENLPERLFYEGMRDLAVRGMRLKLDPPSPPEKEVTAWCELLKQNTGLGFATPFLAREVKRVAGSSLKDHAARELRRLIPEARGEVAQLIAELEGKPPPPKP